MTLNSDIGVLRTRSTVLSSTRSTNSSKVHDIAIIVHMSTLLVLMFDKNAIDRRKGDVYVPQLLERISIILMKFHSNITGSLKLGI